MIKLKAVQKYCKDDPSLIENYEEAINSEEIYDCHHRLETDKHMSVKELKESNLYFNRPASELIFLTHSEHFRLHRKYIIRKLTESQKNHLSKIRQGSLNPFYNHTHNDKARKSISDAQKEHQNKPEVKLNKSKRMKNNELTKNFHWINNGIDNKFVHESKVDYFFNQGYHYGRIKKAA